MQAADTYLPVLEHAAKVSKQASTPASHASVARLVRSATQWIKEQQLKDIYADEARAPSFQISFRAALVGTVCITTVLSLLALFAPLRIYQNAFQSDTQAEVERAVHAQRNLVVSLVFDSVARLSMSAVLAELNFTVARFLDDEVTRTIDSLWLYMFSHYRQNPSWTGRSPGERRELMNYSYLTLLTTWHSTGRKPYTKWLKATWATGGEIGVSMYGRVDNLSMFAHSIPNEGENRKTYIINPLTGNTVEPPVGSKEHNTSIHPAFVVQAEFADSVQRLPGGGGAVLAQQLWTGVYNFFQNGELGISRTTPITPCGNYGCFEGVVECAITLTDINDYCEHQWNKIREVLMQPFYDIVIDGNNSTIFIVGHVSERFPEQQGLLIGGAHILPRAMINATDSSFPIIQATARAALMKFGAWNTPELRDSEQQFTFSMRHASDASEPAYVACDPENVLDIDSSDCMMAGTLSAKLDDQTRWLLVVVLPMRSFSRGAAASTHQMDSRMQTYEESIEEQSARAQDIGLAILGGSAFLSCCLALALSSLLSRRLGALGNLMRRLRDLDFVQDPEALSQSVSGQLSHVAEVYDLQRSFYHLSCGIQAFSRFVPETVVRNIVRGDPQAPRLGVTRRDVTIMFSDIADFTTICESLPEDDMLVLLTTYFTEMTRIIESSGGVVAELLGDGILAYWNTPAEVPEHAACACSAALAQQDRLQLLNREFERLGLPKLAIRIGLHTGPVLSGNIGSQAKMKFGCMGDPVNMASRLEGLCKIYGVGVICSADTYAAVPQPIGLFCRKLDLAQVKGRKEPMCIYELMGCASSDTLSCSSGNTPADSLAGIRLSEALEDGQAEQRYLLSQRTAALREVTREQRHLAQQYEQALDAYQKGRFKVAHDLVLELIRRFPNDKPCARLLERAKLYINEDGSEGIPGVELGEWTGVAIMTEK
jgi:class 3 adenylate cyclase